MPATLTRAESVRSAEAEWRKARPTSSRDPARARAHEPPPPKRLVEQREAAFRDEARRDAEAEDEAARRKREEEGGGGAAKREASDDHDARADAPGSASRRRRRDQVVGLAERKSRLSRTTTTAPDSFAATGIFASPTQSLGATFKSTREEASSYLDEIMRSPSLARASSAARGRAAAARRRLRPCGLPIGTSRRRRRTAPCGGRRPPTRTRRPSSRTSRPIHWAAPCARRRRRGAGGRRRRRSSRIFVRWAGRCRPEGGTSTSRRRDVHRAHVTKAVAVRPPRVGHRETAAAWGFREAGARVARGADARVTRD